MDSAESQFPVGFAVPDWKAPPLPCRGAMDGSYCRLEPLNAKLHAASLYEANAGDKAGTSWIYLPYGPFATFESYCAWMEQSCASADPMFFAIVERSSQRPLGVASYLRIMPENGSIEAGHIHYSPLLKCSRAATEAMCLMMRHVFELGYRRYEWKCNALNAASRAAAQRLGFSYEGVFRQAAVVKGRNRDTAWYAAIDSEWPALKAAFEQWLDRANFDSSGNQRTRLSDLTAPILKLRG